MKLLRKLIAYVLLLLTLVLTPTTFADSMTVESDRAAISYPISSPYYPVALSGRQLPSLIGISIGDIRFYRWQRSQLEPIPFQIDRKDKHGRFIIPDSDRERARELKRKLNVNDECVFMASDLGERLPASPTDIEFDTLTEIELTDSKNGRRSWVYALVSKHDYIAPNILDYVTYDSNQDSVMGQTYRLGYSKKLPFLVDTFQWRLGKANNLSPDVIDTMKIRHTGKFFHRFHFYRTQNDYKSRLTAVKDGPVRVIRRTINRVRMFWGIHSPSVLIDSIHYRYGFVMDIIVDFPFRIGLIFSEVDAVPTIDGSKHPSLPVTSLYSPSMRDGLPITGKMSEAKKRFNTTQDTAMAITNIYGTVVSDISVEKGSPIRNRVYLRDDLSVADPPEEEPGLFGNVGFRMTEWEKLDSQTHHILFRAYILHDITAEQAFRFLQESPSFVE